MRSPINQGAIASPTSVSAWAEASVSVNRAEAFGVGVRVVPMRGTAQVSASTTGIGGRTAYQFSSITAQATAAVQVTRYAWAPAPALQVSAHEQIQVRRYARVQFPVSAGNSADTFDDPIKIIAYSVAFPQPARGVALVWNNDNKTVKLRTRAQYVRGSRIASASVRILPNTVIGIGRTIAESESILDGVSHIQSARASSEATAAKDSTVYSRVRPGVATAIGAAGFAFEPTIRKAGSSVRLSYNSAFPTATAASQSMPKRTTTTTQPAMVCGVEGVLSARRVQKIRGSCEGTMETRAVTFTWHLHRMQGRLQVSAFTVFGPAFYHLRWVEGKARPEGVSQAIMRHLRWTPVTGQTTGRAASSSSNSRRTFSEGATSGRVTIAPVNNRIFRRMRPRVLEPRASATGLGVREAGMEGTSWGEALYLPHVASRAVRWAGHGAQEEADAFADTLSDGLRVTRVRAQARTGRGESEASPLRTVGMQGVSENSGSAFNLRIPVRIALMQGVMHGRAQGSVDDSAVILFHWFRSHGTATGQALSRSDGLKTVWSSPGRVAEGNASVMRTTFKINATADAPDSRLIVLPYPDRELTLPAPDREYYVR